MAVAMFLAGEIFSLLEVFAKVDVHTLLPLTVIDEKITRGCSDAHFLQRRRSPARCVPNRAGLQGR